MNYEEKYNEILEWARKNKARLNGVPIEEVLPELAESEDERIRKTLVEYFGPSAQLDFIRGVPIKKIRDWLEKQKDLTTENIYKHSRERMSFWNGQKKEQKPLHWRRIEDATTQRTDDGCCVTSEKMLVKGWINDGDYRIVDEGTMVNRDILCIPVRELNAEQKEQKPELPKPHKGDDTNPYDMSVSEAQEYAIKRGFGVPFNDGEVYVDERHITQTIGNILRWADEHPKEQKPWKVGANAYFTPEQKPAEWSEDDEKMLERAIHIIVEYSDIDEEESEIVQNWLKSLRPSWKPSEEQMKAMSYFVRKHQATANRATTKWPEFEAFKSLYNELKKL